MAKRLTGAVVTRPSLILPPIESLALCLDPKRNTGPTDVRRLRHLARGSADLSRLEEDGVMVSSRPDGIMLVDFPDCVSSSPQGSPRDLRSEGRHTLGELGLAVAASHRTEGLERGRPTAALLGRRGQRQSIGESAGGGIVGQTPLQQQQLQPGDAAKGGSSSLWGQGGLLSPWRVRLLLLLCARNAVGGIPAWLGLLCCRSFKHIET